MFSLAFDLWFIMAAFSMFLCLLGEVISYFLQKEQKEEQERSLQHICFPVNFAEC